MARYSWRMTVRTLQILIALAACGGTALADGAERVCEQSESTVTPSPGGSHAASVQHQVCDTGAGVSAAITVYVGEAAAPLKGGRVVSVAVPRARGEWPIARWRDERSLEVWVPNLAKVLETQSAYGDVAVTLKYCDDDPEARQRVAQHEVDMQRWMEAVTQWAERRRQDPDAAGPRPERPTEPRARVRACTDEEVAGRR